CAQTSDVTFPRRSESTSSISVRAHERLRSAIYNTTEFNFVIQYYQFTQVFTFTVRLEKRPRQEEEELKTLQKPNGIPDIQPIVDQMAFRNTVYFNWNI
ncbi:Hypothetical predicted protein, partial [Pelobates cultripes]